MPPQRPKRLPTDFFDRLLSNQTDDQINDLLNSLVDEQISPTAEPVEDLMPLVRETPSASSGKGAKRTHRDKIEDSIITRDEELDEIPAPPADSLDELIPKTSRMQAAAVAEPKPKAPKKPEIKPLPAEDMVALEDLMAPLPVAKPQETGPNFDLPLPAAIPETVDAVPQAPEPSLAWPEMPPIPEAPSMPDVPLPPEMEGPAPVMPEVAPQPVFQTAPPAAPAATVKPAPVQPVAEPRPTVAAPAPKHEDLLRARAGARWERPARKPKAPKLAKATPPITVPVMKMDALDQYLQKQKSEHLSLHLSKVQKAAFFFLLPAFISFSLFSWYPMLKGLVISFFDYHPIGTSTFLGFQNYARAFQDEMFWRTLFHAGGFCVLALGLGFWLPILLAVFIQELSVGKRLLRFCFFLPFLMPTVPAAILWKWMMDQGFGLFNSLLAALGVAHPHVGWLTNPHLALLSIVMLYIWKNTGWAVLIYSAGLGNIDETLYEEAEMDGATIWDKVWKVTLPALRGVIGVMLIITIINTLQLFTEVYIMTGGGPMNATEMIATYIYKQAFFYMDIGYASALSVLLLGMLLVITLFRLRRLEPEGA